MPKSSKTKPQEEAPKKNFPKTTLLFFALAAVLLLSLGGGGFFYLKYQEAQQGLAQSPEQVLKETEDLVREVSKIYELPEGEQPTIATVSDLSKLKDQPFFGRSQNGDKVLIYKIAKKAVLYRPSTRKIIEIGPVTEESRDTGVASASDSATLTQTEQLAIAIYNGTDRSGLTKTAESTLREIDQNFAVVSRGNAATFAHQETLVIDLTGTRGEDAQRFASYVGGRVTSLPEGETAPDGAHLLIILGANYQQ